MPHKRRVRFQGNDVGSYSVDRLYRMATHGEIDHTAEFWSEREQAWRPLAGIIFDFYPSRLDEMKAAGITKVEVIGSGWDNECPACRALFRREYDIADAPALPPKNCTCVPWCRCGVIAKR